MVFCNHNANKVEPPRNNIWYWLQRENSKLVYFDVDKINFDNDVSIVVLFVYTSCTSLSYFDFKYIFYSST